MSGSKFPFHYPISVNVVFTGMQEKVEVPEKFNWATVCEFRVEVKKNDNQKFTVWVDDIFVLRDVYEAKPVTDEVPWDELEDEIDGPPMAQRPAVKDNHIFFDDMYGQSSFPTYMVVKPLKDPVKQNQGK